MPAEPKHSIGDQLRAFARQRREAAGDPFEPQPVTRKILQDEVARTFSARTIARQTTPPGWFGTFWIRLSLAAGSVALLAAAAIFWLPKDSQPRTEVAQTRTSPIELPADAPIPSAPVSQLDLGTDRSATSARLSLSPRQNEIEGVQPTLLIPPSVQETSPLLREADTRASQEFSAAPALPSQLAATANITPTNVFFFSQPEVQARYRRNFNSPPVPPVLRSFQVQQSGPNVRIIDADGSVYAGIAEPSPGEPLARMEEGAGIENLKAKQINAPQQQRESFVPSAGIAAGNVTFRAVGTNRTVNERVTIRGELQSNPNQITVAQPRDLSETRAPSQAVTLRAKASIGRNVEIPIEVSNSFR